MLKQSFKQLLKVILVMFFVGLFGATSAFGQIMGNNSFQTAHSFGYWEYHFSGTTFLEAGEDDAYYSFWANTGDRLFVRLGVHSDYIGSGMNLQIFDSNQKEIDIPNSHIINPTSPYAFIFENVNGTSNSQNFFIKVNRGTYIGNMVFTVSMEKRIYSSIEKFPFTGIASNPGNTDILANPNGVDSSIITMNLTNNSSIPNGAIVRSITTTGKVSPNKNGLLHKISINQDNIWRTAAVNGNGYDITVNDDLEVKRIWSFRYNQKVPGASTMKDVEANINYEYDITNGF
ncbi:hypothetical protein FE246_03415 [Aliarcobacter thereius]|uniref:Uncharacterized protein n=1 Tax=Aliarcobacter thereius TaxID=544718 RepID=A0A5R9H502_9BACT|nr:hypothetical protein [Aliarcobacter thereius]TLS72450.1 hypothetical protein FE246_03415 [Aliarcobacter thereius]